MLLNIGLNWLGLIMNSCNNEDYPWHRGVDGEIEVGVAHYVLEMM